MPSEAFMQSIDMLLETAREFLHQIAASCRDLALALAVVLSAGCSPRQSDSPSKRRCAPSISTSSRSAPAPIISCSKAAAGRYDHAVRIVRVLAGDSGGADHRLQRPRSHVHHRSAARVVLFAPKVLVAMLVVVFGSYFARFVGEAVTTYCNRAQIPTPICLARSRNISSWHS
jgi:hypothetical protein